MEDINNMLFDSEKKVALPVCPSTSMDGIGSDLLAQDFLKVPDHGALSANGSDLANTSNFTDQLLIMNNDLNGQREMTLDDVVDLDLSSLENTSIGPQLSREPLVFGDFLGESNFCLNGLSEKLSEGAEPDKSLSFGNFSGILDDSSCDPSGGKGFKVVPHYVDGKLTNTIHLSPIHIENNDHLTNGDMAAKLFQQTAPSADLSIQNSCPSDNNRVLASIEDFPSISSLSPGIPIKINGDHPVLPVVESHNGIDPEFNDLIKVKPKPVKTKSKVTKQKNSKAVPVSKKRKKKMPTPAVDCGETKDSFPAVIPRFKIVHKPDEAVSSTNTPAASISEPQPVAQPSTTNCFNNGSPMFVTTSANTTAIAPPAAPIQKSVELILPVISARREGQAKPVLKPISELSPEDVCTVQRDPMRKLSKVQLQQIINFLRQRKAFKNSPSDPGQSEQSSKIVCRVLYPDEFRAQYQSKSTLPSKVNDASKKDDEPPKSKKMKKTREDINAGYIPDINIAPSVTRSGRTSRPPKKLVLKQNVDAETTDTKSDGKIDSSKECGSSNGTLEGGGQPEKPKPQLLEGFVKARKKLQLQHSCPTCGKQYFDRKTLLKHLEKFPLHADEEYTSNIRLQVNNEIPKEDPKKKCKCKCKVYKYCRAKNFPLEKIVEFADEKDFLKACASRFAKSTSVWDFVCLRVKAIYKFEDYVKGLLNEIGKFVDAIKCASRKMLYPSNQRSETTVELHDDTICDIMGVCKGIYQTYPSGLEPTRPSDHQDLFFEKDSVPTLQSELDMVHPDSKEDISQSSLLSDILCDKSGMDTVDQLVNERLKTLAPGDEILIDPPSDELMTSLLDSVHSGSLSESMFNQPGSGSTEDLLKVLETLSNEIQPNPPPLDFAALSSEFSTPDS